MDTQAKQHLLSTLCELGFCIGSDKSLFMIFPNFANFWLGHHNSACYTNYCVPTPHPHPPAWNQSIVSVTQKFNTLTFLYIILYTVTQTEESKSRRKAEHEDLLNVRNAPFKLTSVFSLCGIILFGV